MNKFRTGSIAQQVVAFAFAFVFSSACVLSAVGPAQAVSTNQIVGHAVA